MGGSERFRVGEYDGGGGLSEKLVFWPEFGDKADSFEGFGFRRFEHWSAVRNCGKGSVDGEEWTDGGASSHITPDSSERRWQRSHLFWLFFGRSVANQQWMMLGVWWLAIYDLIGGGCVRISDGKLKSAALDGGRWLKLLLLFLFFFKLNGKN